MNTTSEIFLSCLLILVAGRLILCLPCADNSGIDRIDRIIFFGKETPQFLVYLAMSLVIFSILYPGNFLLLSVENKSFMSLFFEAIPAISSVGVSTGITGMLTDSGKIILTCPDVYRQNNTIGYRHYIVCQACR